MSNLLKSNLLKFDLSNKKIWIAGETGMVGRAVLKALETENVEIISAPHSVLDFTNQQQTFDWLGDHKPDVIIMAAAKVGGIGANNNDQAGFLYENLAMAQNVIHGAYKANVQKLLYLGSSCIYPKDAPQPITEESLFTGALEPTNEGYALAKIAGLKLCQYYRAQYGCDFISAMPTNLYGPNDHYDATKSHVIPALMMKIYQAKQDNKKNVTLWGTGEPLREFLYVDDLAEALVMLLKNYSESSPINIGSGREISIKELSQMIANIIGYGGEIIFDTNHPNGMMRKIIDSSKINKIGWRAKTELQEGLQKTYEDFVLSRQ